MEDLKKEFGSFIILIIILGAKSTLKYFTEKLEKWKKPKQLVKSSEASTDIKAILKEIADYVGAQRVYTLGYSNSTKTLDGMCFYYVNMIEEHCPNEHPMINQFQGIQTAQFSELLTKIEREKIVYVPENEDSTIGSLHRSRGMKDAYKFLLGKTLAQGTLSVAFTHERARLTKEEIKYIKDRVLLINILNNKKK